MLQNSFVNILKNSEFHKIFCIFQLGRYTEKHPRNNKDSNPPIPPSTEKWSEISSIWEENSLWYYGCCLCVWWIEKTKESCIIFKDKKYLKSFL